MSTTKIERPSLVKSTSVISAFTILSRILGFIRDILIAKFFGATLVAEAFFVSFRIPNLLRNLIGEGSVNAAVVPVLSEYAQQKNKEEFALVSNMLMVLAFIILSILTLAGVIFAPVIVRLIAPGFMQDSYRLQLTIRLTRIMFPYLLFIGLTACSMGILHSQKSFFSSAVGPCLLNISIIAGSILAANTMQEPVYGLAAGVLVGGLLQLIIQLPYLKRIGFAFKKIRSFAHPAIQQIRRLLIPRLFGSAVYQLNIFVDTMCSSLSYFCGFGAVAAIYYANRIVQLPLAVFGIALASAVLPSLSRLAEENTAELRKTIQFCLKSILLVMVPSTFALCILAQPVIQTLFQRGSFDSYATAVTASALFFYALGLCAYGGLKIMISSFHALKDTKTPVRAAALGLAINIVLNIVLMRSMKVAGIALASSIAATIQCSLLLCWMSKRIGTIIDRGLVVYFLRLVLIAAVMGGAVAALWYNLCVGIQVMIRLPLVVILGCGSFIGLCLLVGGEEKKILTSWISKRK
ncbi:murein biosynthesis integral membrane protein MurJ [Candidatus Omnitrophota bacterium]